MENCVISKLEQLGYIVNNRPYGIISVCNSWYKNEIIDNFHKRTTIQGEEYEIERMGFAKRGCADDANLCEVISVNMGISDNEGTNEQTDAVNGMMETNRFNVMYRKQLERMSATGTVAAYVRLDNATHMDNGKVKDGDICIQYCFAENYIPLTVVNDEVIEAAFTGTDVVKNGKKITLVIFTCTDGIYKADTYTFDKDGKETEYCGLQLGEVKPFAVMRVAEVNNLHNMAGFGLPKIYNAIPVLKKLDLCNMIMNGDLEKGEKLLLTNEMMINIDANTGKPKEKSKLMRKLFIFLGEKVPDQKSLVQEYNPVIRIEDITKTFELCLSLFSMMFGFGSKKYTFENGQIQTATQYIGERQDAMQDLNKQRQESIDYISGIIKAMLWFSNTFHGTSYDLDAEISIDFDDSYIEDKNTMVESMRADAVSFSDIPEFTIRYIAMRLNVDTEEARRIYEGRTEEIDPEMND